MFSKNHLLSLAETESKIILTPEQTRKLSESLKQAGYPGDGIVSLDGRIYPTLTISQSVFFFDQYKISEKNIDALNISCELGSFDALIKRVDLCQAMAKDQNKHPSTRQRAAKQLESDLDNLSKLYSTVGSLHAARIYLDLANYYHNNEDYPNEDVRYQEKAAKCYYLADLLFLDSSSLSMMDMIYGKDNFGTSGWKDMAAAKEEILKNIPDAKQLILEADLKTEVENLRAFQGAT